MSQTKHNALWNMDVLMSPDKWYTDYLRGYYLLQNSMPDVMMTQFMHFNLLLQNVQITDSQFSIYYPKSVLQEASIISTTETNKCGQSNLDVNNRKVKKQRSYFQPR